jgi:hypothetical protein
MKFVAARVCAVLTIGIIAVMLMKMAKINKTIGFST